LQEEWIAFVFASHERYPTTCSDTADANNLSGGVEHLIARFPASWRSATDGRGAVNCSASFFLLDGAFADDAFVDLGICGSSIREVLSDWLLREPEC
jgi:hypothetical protein